MRRVNVHQSGFRARAHASVRTKRRQWAFNDAALQRAVVYTRSMRPKNRARVHPAHNAGLACSSSDLASRKDRLGPGESYTLEEVQDMRRQEAIAHRVSITLARTLLAKGYSPHQVEQYLQQHRERILAMIVQQQSS